MMESNSLPVILDPEKIASAQRVAAVHSIDILGVLESLEQFGSHVEFKGAYFAKPNADGHCACFRRQPIGYWSQVENQGRSYGNQH